MPPRSANRPSERVANAGSCTAEDSENSGRYLRRVASLLAPADRWPSRDFARAAGPTVEVALTVLPPHPATASTSATASSTGAGRLQAPRRTGFGAATRIGRG